IWSKDERLVSSVYATAQTVADPYLDPNVQAVTDIRANEKGASWVDLEWLMGAPEGKANTLYLVVPLDDYDRLAPVLGGFLSDLKAQAYEWDVAGRQLGAPLLMLIDEAGNMPLAWLPQVASTCAGIGIQLVTIWQSLAQIEEAYGRLANSVITNHATKLFFPSASDESTLGYQSKIAGDEDVERRSWSADKAGGRRSVSGSEQREPLVPYHVPRLAPLGQALLIHGNIPPAVVSGRKWWKDRRLRALAKGGPPLPAQPADERRAA
ncbi:MAG TPA: TraM recognition domain-containing protein, partial [Ilumatobacteraceae bacterium]|nr:TraM recognition domain-containing protein [Ilumatobacteraceae bacterium]